jgi:hypothetical protein
MNALWKAFAAALLLLASTACSSGQASGRALSACPPASGDVPRPQGEGWHHGPIVQVDSAGAEGRTGRRLLVQVQPPGAWSGRIWFGVSESTHLVCRSGERLDPSAPLTPGMTVSAWTQMILESDPGQAGADTLIVDAA